MKAVGQYDTELQMFVQPSRVSPERLTFLRWLADNGHLEHDPAGRPAGSWAQVLPCPWRDQGRPDPGHDFGYKDLTSFN